MRAISLERQLSTDALVAAEAGITSGPSQLRPAWPIFAERCSLPPASRPFTPALAGPRTMT
ncbi:MAG TPA: hypothetical protein VFA20_13825 [Myxococcaceae bacterium]|nr:hypothetical protein [Myxococcaceae bacterium]